MRLRSLSDSMDPWSNDEIHALLRIRSNMENWFSDFILEHVPRYYDNLEHLAELVVSILENMLQVLSNFRAYLCSSPTVVDLDGDGNLDIFVGTSFGLFYALDRHGVLVM